MFVKIDNTCRVCLNEMQHVFDTVVLKKYEASVFHCPHCGLMQVHNPTWLDEAYSSPIAQCDTGLVGRNLYFSNLLKPMLFHVFGTEKRFVDFAGGTGLLTRLMRDAGFDYYWHDSFCDNVHARGFEFTKDDTPYDCVTAFELLEHVTNPTEFIEDTIRKTQAGVLIFSTILYEGVPPSKDDWSYYAFETGQHVSFYQKKTLQIIADRFGFNFNSFKGLHLFYNDKYSELFNNYLNSRLTRRIACYKGNRSLQPKTVTDNQMLSANSRSLL